jgi:hypothetical protein
MSSNKENLLPVKYEERAPQVLVSKEGKWVCVKQQIDLYEKLGHIYKVKNNWKITADGYDLINRVTGVNIFKPDYLILPDGKQAGNPYTEKDAYQNINRITTRILGSGYTRTGNLAINDVTVTFDLDKYFRQEIVGLTRIANNPPAKICKRSSLNEKELANGLWFVIEPVNEIIVYASLTESYTKKILANKVDREKFAERIAYRLAKRTCLAQHPSIGISGVEVSGPEGQGHAVVEVYGWVHYETPGMMLSRAVQYERERKGMDGFFGEELNLDKDKLPDPVKVEVQKSEQEFSDAQEIQVEEKSEEEIEAGTEPKVESLYLDDNEQANLHAKCQELGINWTQFLSYIAFLKPPGYEGLQKVKAFANVKKESLPKIYEGITEFAENLKTQKKKS